MSCNNTNKNCGCNFNLGCYGLCDTDAITINGADRTQLNWNEISIPEILPVPTVKPEIEHLDQVFVSGKINCAKLIETPFSYKTYNRLSTTLEITTVTDAINLAVVDITPIIDAVNAILAIPGLPVIPAVAALIAALTEVEDAATNLTNAINDALAALALPCITASALILIIQSVSQAISLLQAALNALIAAANVLVTATAAIPVVGPLVSAAVGVLLTAINVVLTSLLTAAQALLDATAFIGNTMYFAIAPNAEGTCLSGRKIVIDGVLKQKVVYTSLLESQSVHSFHNEVPFAAYIIPYAKFVGLEFEENVEVVVDLDTCETTTINGFAFNPDVPIEVDTCEEFNVQLCIEDIFANMIDTRTVFKNITVFLRATPTTSCP